MMLSIFASSTSGMLLIHNPILEIYFTQILHVCLIVLFNADPNLKTVLFMPKANFDLLRILSNLKSQFAAVRVNIDWCFICFFHELYLLVHGNTFQGCFSVNTVSSTSNFCWKQIHIDSWWSKLSKTFPFQLCCDLFQVTLAQN